MAVVERMYVAYLERRRGNRIVEVALKSFFNYRSREPQVVENIFFLNIFLVIKIVKIAPKK